MNHFYLVGTWLHTEEKVSNVQAWFFKVVFNIKPLWDWMSSVEIA